jgi:precorrin-8X/cobalt-precorrin-8 methylmutase
MTHPIEERSYAILHERVDLSGWPVGARDIVARIIHATADESFATSMRIGPSAIAAAVAALRAGAPVVCDARMVVAGVPPVERMTDVRCYLDQVPQAGPFETRSAAAIARAAEFHPDGAIWVVGNAPTALTQLLTLGEAGAVRPAAVIGLPVGYVGASEAKDALWGSGWRDRAVTNRGVRGGSPTAAAAMNALARLAVSGFGQDPSATLSPR